MNLNSYIKNSQDAQRLQVLTEDIGVASIDGIISAVIEQKRLSSLAYQICEVAPIHGPRGGTFALVYQNKKIQVLRGEVAIEEDAIEDTGFTIEAFQDLQSQFGMDMPDYVGRAFGGISCVHENEKLLSVLEANSTTDGTITLSNPGNPETVLFETSQKIAMLVIKINAKYYRSLDSFAILPNTVAAAVLASSNWTLASKDASGLFLGNTGRTKFYLNPDPTATKVYVGIKSDIPGNSSLILSPYQHLILTATNPETASTNMFNINRYAITPSKMAVVDPMLYSFEIN